ncbi:MAG TPA: CDP-glucose 4,6-dehydratase [Patescibacteria group bacterium]|nr:CDP-glucose 4,6-dehydratase [Patescibacteria group bacterium]
MDSDLSNFFKGKKVLVTGHTGFKGAWLTEILYLWGAKVSGVSLESTTEPNLFDILKLEEKISNYYVDIRDQKKLHEIFEKEQPEIVFHLAAQAIVKVSYDEPLRTYETNVVGTANVLQSIRETKSIKSAVIITSDKVYENKEWVHPYREIDRLGGIDPYSASKAAADIIAQSFIKCFLSESDSPLVAITRAGNVIGGGDWSPNRIVPDIVRAVHEKDEVLVMRSPKSIRPWQFVLEPLSGYLLLAKKMYEGDKSLVTTWNFGPNDENFVPVQELVETGIKILEKGSYKIIPDASFHESGLLKLDISKSRSLLAWKPKLNLKQTLDYTFGWYRNFYGAAESHNHSEPANVFTDHQISEFFGTNK